MPDSMLRRFLTTAGLPLAGMAILGGAMASASGTQTPKHPSTDFVRDVQPILKAHCYQCHGDGRLFGGLDVRTRETLLKGGVTGVAVVPGKSKESLLVQRILGQGGKDRMPLGFGPLSEKETNTIRDWIDQGATAGSNAPVKKHWAFVNPVRPKLPVVKDKQWVKNPIDAFVLARLEREGLKPSPQAGKTTLLRRLTLDLTGLPPTPQEVDAFNADHTANAYEKVVDRLLASPHFGERLALPWLDAARYADSNGFQQDGDTYQYVWRDWVVKAINDDMPFDEFTVDQIAGDLLPHPTHDQIIATAFNRNHMLNGEGGAIPEEQRNVVLFDRVDVTSTTWMALTMACARCHDHKYDPITQRDYYSLMAYFNNVPESGVPSGSGQYRVAEPFVFAGTADQVADLAKYQSLKSDARLKLSEYVGGSQILRDQSEWERLALQRIRGAEGASVKFQEWLSWPRITAESFDKAFDSDGVSCTLSGKPPVLGEIVDGRVNELTGDNTSFVFSRNIETDRPVTYLLSLGSDDGIKVWLNEELILSKKVTRAATPDSELIRVTFKAGVNSLIVKIVNGGGIGGVYFKSFSGGVKPEIAAVLVTPAAKRDRAQVKSLREYFLSTEPPANYLSLKRSEAENDDRIAKLQGEMPQVMVMSDAMPRKTHVLSRGDYEQPLEEVHPNTPTVLPPLPKTAPSNRLALANWIVSPSNPLTARVAVNRYWQMLFGRGLVKTSENFGVQGEPPTHPELLDWLAVDFRESGWKVRRLIKLIVMSNTYRQSSKVTKTLLDKDQDNRLLARGARFRMSSLILRDVALSSSGLLNPAIGGKPVYPYQPAGIWDGLAITKERDFTYPQSKGADLYRRSVYTFWRRTAAPGNMFDAPSRQACTVRASMTSTPLHALTTLNDTTWVEAARVLAQNVMRITPTPEGRLAEGFRRVCARRPNPVELKVLLNSLNRSYMSYKTYPHEAKAYIAIGDSKPDPRLDPAELAAYASVCLAVYNLDEALTRE